MSLNPILLKYIIILCTAGPIGYYSLRSLYKNSIFFKIGGLWFFNVFCGLVIVRVHLTFPDTIPFSLALAFGIILTLGMQYPVYRAVKKPLDNIKDILNQLGNGTIPKENKAFEGSLKGELLQLHESSNFLQSKLREVIQQIEASAVNVNALGETLSATSVALSEGASEQASSIEEVSSSMEEMAANINANSHHALSTKENASKTDIAIKEGQLSSQETLELMTQIADRVKVIDEISVQTNLLALNASVEASRAGDSGKGFSVVAKEVRNLADRSKMAAQEIEGIVHAGFEKAKMAASNLKNTLPLLEASNNLVQEIYTSSNEQNIGASQINHAIQEINNTTQNNAAIAEEVASSSNQMGDSAGELLEKIHFFKIV